MPRKSALDFMIEFVRDYLDGKSGRLDFDLDFNYYLKQNYSKMERANPDLAECFLFYLAEEGYDKSESLSDKEHKKLIRRQFKEFISAMSDGLY